MADFNLAFPVIAQNEGGYCNVSGDKGGETYMGISRNYYPNWIGWATIDICGPLKRNDVLMHTDITNDVLNFYKLEFWDKMHGDEIVSQSIATYILDWYVNSGGNAIKAVQTLLGVDDDGCFGPGTLAALNAAGDILGMIHNVRCKFYRDIAVDGNEKFLAGWLNRADTTYNKLR
jgi:lysozyme family protein